MAHRCWKKTLTKQKKNSKVRSHWSRSAPNRHFCHYSNRLKCPLIKGGCPLQDNDFIDNIRFYALWSRGLKSTPLQPRVVSENAQVLENTQFFKLLEITFIFDSLKALDDMIKMLEAPISEIHMTYMLCRFMRAAHRKWLMHLAPPGHRIRRAVWQSWWFGLAVVFWLYW